MGTRCYIDAPANVLERIAGLAPGAIVEIIAADADRKAQLEALKLAAEQIEFLDCYTHQNAECALYEAMWTRMHSVATIAAFASPGSIDTSFVGEPMLCLETFSGWKLTEGLPNTNEHGGQSEDATTMARIIANQSAQRYDGYEPADLKPEFAQALRRYRTLCQRALIEIAAGNVRSVFWG